MTPVSAPKPACGGENCSCETCFCDKLDAQVERKLRARRGRPADAWYGLGLFGLVGWGVAAPTLLGIALGVWLDRVHPVHASWTLMGLGFGLVVGCVNGLVWISREHGQIGGTRDAPKDATAAVATKEEQTHD